MDKYRLQWVGSKCGQHGPYTFYKGFKFIKNSKWRTLSLGEFFFVKCSENDPLCIAELQLLWEDRGTDGIMLSSLRLYFLPEHTPDGRHHSHGENEVIAVNGKAIISIEDLLDWVIMEDVRWIDGFPTVCPTDNTPSPTPTPPPEKAAEPDDAMSIYTFTGDEGERDEGGKAEGKAEGRTLRVRSQDGKASDKCNATEDKEVGGQKMMVVSYPSYCRYHANLQRIGRDGDKWRNNPLLKALGLLSLPHPQTKVLFCKDEFEHPMLEEDERLCEYTAPKLKGRPRKKKVKLKSDDNDRYEPPRQHILPKTSQNFLYAGKRSDRLESRRSSTRGGQPETCEVTLARLRAEFRRGKVVSEEIFLTHLYKYMKDRNTPIERIPNLGFKQIDLFGFFELAVQLGGYKMITDQKQWKIIYDKLGGNPNSTSAATCTRRHYEKLLFPFELYLARTDVSGASGDGKEKRKKKEKKEKKKSRVKHVREQLQELEAMRAAARQALGVVKTAERAPLNNVIKIEPSSEMSTTTTTVTNSMTPASATPITTAPVPLDVKPGMGLNGTPLVALPSSMVPSSMVPTSSLHSVVQLSNSNLFPQLGIKNMGQVILAIPQVPVIAATSLPKSEPESPTIGQQAGDQKPSGAAATVLDKVAGGVSLLGQREIAEVKQEEVSFKTDKVHHHAFNHSVRREDSGGNNKSRLVVVEKPERSTHSGHVNSMLYSSPASRSRDCTVSRPSVIQHTQQTAVKTEPGLVPPLIRPPLGHVGGLMHNNALLRNMNLKQEQIAAEHEHYRKAVAEMPHLLAANPRLLSPYMTFLPQAAPLLFRPPPVELPTQVKVTSAAINSHMHHSGMDAVKNQTKVLDSAGSKPQVSLVQPLRSSSTSSSSSSSSSRSAKYEPPVQDEPCDLSLPKKRRHEYQDEGAPSEKRRESVISAANVHSSGALIRNSPVHRLRTSDKKFHKHSSSSHPQSRDLHVSRSSPSPLLHHHPHLLNSSSALLAAKVKMTPDPRGSITQGIINPSKSQPHLTHHTHKEPVDTPKTPPSKVPPPPHPTYTLASPHFPLDLPGLSLPVAVDSSGKPLAPLGDLNPLARFPMFPYYPMLPRPPFLPAGSPFLPGTLPQALPTSQAENILPHGLLFRPPFPIVPSVPYSTAQLSRDNQHASLYRN